MSRNNNRSVWNKIFAIRETFHKHFENDVSQHNVQIQSEWYAFSQWIYTIYRKSFVSRDERKSFEYEFSLCSTNTERVHCFMACHPVQTKFAKYAKKLWQQSDVPAKNELHKLKKWLIKNNYFQKGNTEFETCSEQVADSFAEIERLANSEEGIEEIHLKYAPNWDDYADNDSLRGVSKSVKLGNHPIKRRQLLAATDITKGSVIARENALCVWLAPIMYSTYCYHCLVPLPETRITCRGCKIANFCSAECYTLARDQFHGKECEYLGMLKHLSIFHFTLRLLLVLGPSKVVAASMSQFPSSFDYKRTEFYSYAEGGDSVKSFLNLEYGTQGVSKSDLLTFSCTALFTVHLLREMSIFDIKYPEKPLFCSLISMMILTSRNIFTLYDHTFRMLKVPGSTDKIIEGPGKEIGHGLFYKTSLFNHSCNPNSHAVFFGASILVLTTKDIETNEEITISYGAKYPEMKLEDRHNRLRNNFYFNCFCDQCENDLIERARGRNCEKCFDELCRKIVSGQVIVNDSGELVIKDDQDQKVVKGDENGDSARDTKCTDCKNFLKKKIFAEKVRKTGLEHYTKARRLIHKEEYERAIRYLEKSLEIFVEVNDIWYMYLARDDLSTIYRTMGEYKKAFIHSVDNLKIRGQLYETDSPCHANLLLSTIENAKNAEISDIYNEEIGEIILKIVHTFRELHSQLESHQAKFIDHINTHYIDFCIHQKTYDEWLKGISQEIENLKEVQQLESSIKLSK